MSKHTPEPWHVIPGSPLEVGSSEFVICNLLAPDTNESALADARLIAAAPELLECLKDAARDFSIMRMGNRMEKWDAVIAETEGRDG